MVDLKAMATKKMKEAIKEEKKQKKKQAKESKNTELPKDDKEASSSAIVKVDEDKDDGEGTGVVADSDILYLDEEVPFGPLGIFPENYTDLQAKVVKEAEREVRAEAEKREKDGKERLTRVINVQPSPGGFLGQLGSLSRVSGGSGLFGLAKTPPADPAGDALLKGLGSLLSPEASRPMAVLDDNIARIVPGVSGVPEELRNLGVGPTLYSVLQRSPGLSEALLEM
ncbi:unnamed protein product, partial [Ectocarpus sp. 8 AP-2014]